MERTKEILQVKIEEKSTSKAISRDDIKKIIKQEIEILESKETLNEKKHLVLKLTEKQIKKVLVYDVDTKKYLPQFTMQWYTYIETFIKYKVSQANTFELDIDNSVNSELKNIFMQTWKKYFSDEILKVHSDIKAIKRKIKLYSIFGSLIILAIIAAFITYAFVVEPKVSSAFAVITIILGNGVYVFGWGMLWDVFTNVFGDLSRYNKRLENILMLYKA